MVLSAQRQELLRQHVHMLHRFSVVDKVEQNFHALFGAGKRTQRCGAVGVGIEAGRLSDAICSGTSGGVFHGDAAQWQQRGSPLAGGATNAGGPGRNPPGTFGEQYAKTIGFTDIVRLQHDGFVGNSAAHGR